ncbi:hypothetical protein B4Q04_20175 [Zobellia sp. OII3]|uniref:hypothetical protein n=1 Tax=Zobellia sp. OII3 TaxID=2034520 RepID=UPI000B5374D2|nr:hypothetical protein [Zobellia sp. OII3]OWW23518.1 hypothetical protein B4Q04_20175 [Zobellia sp. OII3]
MKLKLRTISFIVCLLFFSVLNAQKTKATLIFKDGTKKDGCAKLSGSQSLKFRSNEKERTTKYHFSKLERVFIYDTKEPSIYVYREVPNKKKSMVLQEVVTGKVTLYSMVDRGYRPMYTGGNLGSGGYIGGNFYEIKNLYLETQDENGLTHLGSNQLFTKNFKKAASDFFKNCNLLVEKIKNTEFRKKDIKEIVIFYNNKCK